LDTVEQACCAGDRAIGSHGFSGRHAVEERDDPLQ
jgi:hypothetical protein